ncbi:MAG: pantoate--beta-alanine ligase [Puia sp.]|nr:pantoate--beta-alanine ligase [Puia sp.]
MILFKRSEDLAVWLAGQRQEDRSVGFVPTMGALHPGHISLIDMSKKTSLSTVCSIFVNPTQFNDPKDFQKYPITLENDILLLERAGTDVLFLPGAGDLYPTGISGLERYDLGYLETVLDGHYRPGHFQGVCQVMRRLLDRVRPRHLFMGRKDYQQCMVVKRLLTLMGSDTILHPCPTLREAGGLAMSSRNMRLSAEQREQAKAIFQTLLFLKENCRPGELGDLTQQAVSRLQERGFRIDYVEIADADTLEKVTRWDGNQPLVALIAAFLGEVRLIDNMSLTPEN